MDALIETIADQLGPKWIQLYSHLLLGARDRYKFETNHKGEPEKIKLKNCATDSMRLWVKNQGQGVEEKEAMRGLLLALRKTRGFADLAEELARRNGIVLAPPEAQPVVAKSLPTAPSLSATMMKPACPPSMPDVPRTHGSYPRGSQRSEPLPPHQQIHHHTMTQGQLVSAQTPFSQPRPLMAPQSQPHPPMPSQSQPRPPMPSQSQPRLPMAPQSQPHLAVPPQSQPRPPMAPATQQHPPLTPLFQPGPSVHPEYIPGPHHPPSSHSPLYTELPPQRPQTSLQQTAQHNSAPRNYTDATLVHQSLPQRQTDRGRPLAPESLSAPVESPHLSHDRDWHPQLPSSQPFQPPTHRPQTAPHQLVQHYPDEWHSRVAGGDLHSGPLPDQVGTSLHAGEQFSQLAPRYTAPTFTPEHPGHTPFPPNPPTTHGRSSVSSTGGFHRSLPEGSALLYSSGSEPPFGHHNEEDQDMSSGGGPRSKVMTGSVGDLLHSEPHSKPLHQDLYVQPDAEELQRPIDLTRMRHKFALLDLAQRLAPDKWSAIGRQLDVSQRSLQIIEDERQPEERYYKVLKQWVFERKAEATFAALRGVLESHEQFGAVSVMVRRLQTTGMTLN